MAHRLEDRGRLVRDAGTVRPDGQPEAAVVQRHRQDLGVGIGHREAQQVRHALRRMPVHPDAGDPVDLRAQRPGHRPPTRRLVTHVLARGRQRGGHRDDAGDVLHAGAPLAFPVVPARVGGEGDAAPDEQRADARRPAELVRR
jgi:hypothetical protein